MSRVRRRLQAAAAQGAAIAALVLACAAQAQSSGSANDYQLPPAASPAPAPAEGPVDSDHPVATPTRTQPEPSPAPSAAPPTEIAPPIVVPVAPTQPVGARKPRPSTQSPATAPQIAASPFAPQTPASGAPIPTIAGSGAPVADASPASAAPAPTGETPYGWLLLAGGMIALIAGVLVIRRRRSSREPAVEPPPAEGPAEVPSAPAALPPIVPAARPAPLPLPAEGPIALALQPQSLRLSVVYATLSYRLEITNRGDAPLQTLTVAGDLSSGHASRSVGQQLSLGDAPLETKHDAASLAPGETLSVTGELRLPLAEVLPLRAGRALLFAPLARFRIDAQRSGHGHLSDTHVFSLGQPGLRQGDTMQPFRLDLGPQLFREVEQREIDVSRWLQLDEARRAG